MIILNMKDGLGNQMFEYAFAKYLQKQNPDHILINTFFMDGKKRKSYSLNHFKIDENVVVASKPKQLLHTICFVARLFSCYPKVFIKWIISNERPVDEKTFAFSASKGMYVHFNTFHKYNIPMTGRRNKYIYGNYENYAYVENLIDELRKEFEVVSEPSEKNQKMIEELSQSESVCVHIRRGDYLDPRWKMLNVCTFNYYQNGMNAIQREHPNAKFYIFSNTHDDLEWIKSNYYFNQSVEYVDLSNPDYEEIRLMNCCKHFIISNSTFSWWAAVLSESKEKMVVAPEMWIADSTDDDYKGLYLPSWITLPTT